MTRRSIAACCVCAATFSASARPDPPTSATFYNVGVLPGGQFSQPFGISRDGTTVVGNSPVNLGSSAAFSWRVGSGITQLHGHPDFVNPVALTVNADGNIIAGVAQLAANPNYGKVVRWIGSSLTPVPDPEPITPSSAWGMSADGSVMTGSRGANAFRWTQAGGFQDIGTLPGQNQSRGFSVSADGSVIVGETPSDAFRWTAASGMVTLPRHSGSVYARANAVSGDGLVAVGESGSAATRWVGLNLPQILTFGGDWSEARGVDHDGDSVVGTGMLPGGSSVAFLWTPELGLKNLNTYLPTLGVDLTGWQLYEARSISADGLTMVGTGYHTIPGFGQRQEAWVVQIPAPQTLPPLVAGLAVSPRRRRSTLR